MRLWRRFQSSWCSYIWAWACLPGASETGIGVSLGWPSSSASWRACSTPSLSARLPTFGEPKTTVSGGPELTGHAANRRGGLEGEGGWQDCVKAIIYSSKSLQGFSLCFGYSTKGYSFLTAWIARGGLPAFFLSCFCFAATDSLRLKEPTATRSRWCLRTCHPSPSGKSRHPAR